MSEPLDPAELEKALRSLVPHPAQIDRDQLMFQAGRAARSRIDWFRPTLSGIMTLAVVVLGAILWWHQPETRVERIIVQVPGPQAPAGPENNLPAREETQPVILEEPPAAMGDLSYYRLVKQVLRWGADGLPALPPLPAAGPSGPPLPDLGSFYRLSPGQGF